MTAAEKQALIDKRNQLVSEQRQLIAKVTAEKRKRTADETKAYEDRETEFDTITEKLEMEEKQSAHKTFLDTLANDKGLLGGKIQAADVDGTAGIAKRKLNFDKFLRSGLQSLTAEERDGMIAGSDPDGGYLVAPFEIVSGLLKAIDEICVFRKACDIKRLTTGAALGQATLDTDMADCSWTTEIQSAPIETAMQFGRRDMKTNAMRKLVKISNKLLRLSDPTQEVMDRLAVKIAATQETAYMTGNGTGQPLGIFIADADGIPTSRDLLLGANTNWNYTALINMIFGIKDGYLPGASFVMNKDILKLTRTMTDGDGRYIFVPGTATVAGDTLLGYPVIRSAKAPTATTNGSYLAVFGNFKYYRVVDALDTKITKLNELFQATAQVGFIGEYEGDGQPIMAEAFIRAKVSA